MSLIPTSRDWRLANADFINGIRRWQIWYLLGVSDIRQRYKRSRFGQFWITFSMAIFIAGIGFVYSFLFHQPIHEYIPYLSINYIVWSLISGIMTDGTTAFTSSAVFLRQDALPRTVFVLRLLVRNLIAFGHNIIILPIVFLLFEVVPSWTVVLAIPGLLLLLVAGFLLALLFGLLSTRFRDLPQIIQNLIQVLFFVTPVMWRPDQMGGQVRFVVELNPVGAFLRLVTEPLHGQVPDLMTYGYAFVIIAVLFLLTWPLFARFRARVVYWL
ncbi:lipopolysaccharide transport system permease protein [Pseudoxanthobacter soli DSM 19599]|uniref:Lipopolysaccharide transport system permease protein n=1 Tax=Pseudoxanthobacter soli DSM 19599 TaxID=1123029 RepID=A0A1M7ZPS0_9HYPH|nr:ABC transporter permease [Pseudoxanthobacter soli]SHO66930.1 lipopolysaccharide transport system permease protein [Pseudoxanthobacter soli DSM 19599]